MRSTTFVKKDFIAKGSFGRVYEVDMETEDGATQKAATKKMDVNRTGIPTLIEPVIMSSISHPHIARCIDCRAHDSALYIMQPLAEDNMHAHRSRHEMPLPQLCEWAHALVSAVDALHRARVVHCDIKCDNILVVQGQPRLADFSLACVQVEEDQTFTHDVCTINFRPPENLLGKRWGPKLDVWSLGCALYEMAYGSYLIASQASHERGPKGEDRTGKKTRMRQRTLMAVMSWGRFLKKRRPHSRLPSVSSLRDDYTPVSVPVEFDAPQLSAFNDLLFQMLQLVPEDRLSARQALRHPFFAGLRPSPGQLRVPLYRDLSQPEANRTNHYFMRYTDDDERRSIVQTAARRLFSLCDAIKINEPAKVAACCWIACKVYFGGPPEVLEKYEESKLRRLLLFSDPNPHQVLSAERLICNALGFCLLVL